MTATLVKSASAANAASTPSVLSILTLSSVAITVSIWASVCLISAISSYGLFNVVASMFGAV